MGMAQRSIPNPLAHPVRNLYYDLSCRIILSTSCRKRDGLAPRPHVRPFWTKGRREGFRVDFPLTSVQATSQIRPRSESSLQVLSLFRTSTPDLSTPRRNSSFCCRSCRSSHHAE